MQIVVKVARSSPAEAVRLVNDLLRQALPAAEAARASVEPVFPDVKEGRRAGMLVLTLGEGASPQSTDKVLASLRGSEAVEYAQAAAPKTPRAAGSRRS